MPHANPIQIQKYLKGVDYPASKAQLIENARKLGADESICASLEQLPDDDFQTPADVSEAFKGPSSDDVADSGSREFLLQVMQDSLAEMDLCMVALDNSDNAEVKAFAQAMLDEHGKLGQQIEQLAQRMQVAFPKKVGAEHTDLIRRMSALKGEQFDRQFIEQNLRYHENDLKVFEHYAREQEGEVGKLAETGARLFGKHLKMVKELAQTLRR